MPAGSCIRGTICKYENGMLKVARNVFNIVEVWNPVCIHGNKTVKLILRDTFRRIVLQKIKHFSGHLIGCGKKWKILRKFLAILCGRNWRLCGKDARLCGNLSCSLGFFKRIKYMLTSHREFNSCMTSLTFCRHSWTDISSFNAVFP